MKANKILKNCTKMLFEKLAVEMALWSRKQELFTVMDEFTIKMEWQ